MISSASLPRTIFATSPILICSTTGWLFLSKLRLLVQMVLILTLKGDSVAGLTRRQEENNLCFEPKMIAYHLQLPRANHGNSYLNRVPPNPRKTFKFHLGDHTPVCLRGHGLTRYGNRLQKKLPDRLTDRLSGMTMFWSGL